MNILDTIIKHTQLAGSIFVITGAIIIVTKSIYDEIRRARQN
jgi:hypothetical protein